jgi:lipopolysaccharide export LptBFGC system permease protein LptF
MKILDRYIFKEVFFPSVIALVALTFVAFIRQIGALLEIMVRQSATMSEIGAISLAMIGTG